MNMSTQKLIKIKNFTAINKKLSHCWQSAWCI